MGTANLPVIRPKSSTAAWRYWLLAGLGALTIVPVILASALSLPLIGAMEDAQAQIAVLAFIGSSLPEEAMRFVVLYFVGVCWFGLSRPRDGILFGLLVSLGFSAAENLFYGLTVGWATGILKLAIATPMHLALGVTMGGLLATAMRAPRQHALWLVAALAAPLLMHGVYDFVLLKALANSDASAIGRLAQPAGVYLLVAVIAVLTVLRTRRPLLPTT